jgi:hypothetical protein
VAEHVAALGVFHAVCGGLRIGSTLAAEEIDHAALAELLAKSVARAHVRSE